MYLFTCIHLQEWELLVLTTLKWDISAVVSLDFLDHLLARLHLIPGSNPSSDDYKQIAEEIRRFATDLCLMSSKGKLITNYHTHKLKLTFSVSF